MNTDIEKINANLDKIQHTPIPAYDRDKDHLITALRIALDVIARALPHIELKRDCLANAVDNYPLELRQLDKLVGDMKGCDIAKALEGKP